MTHIARIARIALVTLLLFTAAGAASAATLDVCASGCTYSTIQAAVTAASAGDVIELDPATYAEGDILLDKDLTIRTSSGRATIDAPSGSDVVFEVEKDAIVRLEDLTLKGGDVCRLENSGLTTLSTVTVSGGGWSSPSTYGGILNHFVASLTIRDSSVVMGNASTAQGGGITNFGELLIQSSTVTGNQGSFGGGVRNSHGDVTVISSSFSGNNATSKGGAWADLASSGSVTYHSSSSYSTNTADVDCDTYYDYGAAPSCVN